MLRVLRTIPKLTKPALCALGALYLGFHALHGERGLYAWFSETHKQTVLQEQLLEAKAERAKLENRVARMRNDFLDLDLLDEQARQMHSMARPDEVVILLDKPMW